MRTHARGFSLVEILIAILVLGIGLLGLGAVFPAVIAQQRAATDQTEGELRVGEVRGLIERSVLFDPAALAYSDDPLTTNMTESILPLSRENPAITRWQIPGNDANNQPITHVSFVVDGDNAGDLLLPQRTINGVTVGGQTIPAASRLFPHPSSGQQPVYIWDMLTRRQPGTDLLQVAVFVRRIDAGIRVPRGKTLADVLTGRGYDDRPGEPRAIPIGVRDAITDPTPTKNGTGEYAAPISIAVNAVEDEDARDAPRVNIEFRDRGDEDTFGSLAFQEGQRLLDNFGVVRRVVSVTNEGNRLRAVIEPPLPPGAERTEFVFTPQTPVRVEVFVVRE